MARISVYDLTTPDDYRRELAHRAIVLLNGRPVTYVIAADEEDNRIYRYCSHFWPDDKKKFKYWPTEVLRGNVRIVDPLEAEYLAEVYLR
jgi:hypothetical protein